MSIQIGNVSSTDGNGKSITVSHSVANNNNRILIVGVHIEDTNASQRVVQSVTYNGLALTKIDAIELGSLRVELWYRLAPSVGTYNVVATMGGFCTDLSIGAMTIYDAKQQAPEVTAKNSASSSTVSTNITTLTNDALLISVASANIGDTFTHGSGQTDRWNVDAGSSTGTCSTEEIASPSSQTQSETCSGAVRTVQVVSSFEPVSSLVLEVDTYDAVSITEDIQHSFTPLQLNIVEPFSVLITEHTDVLDLVVEVGVVMDAVSAIEAVDVVLSTLNVSVSDIMSVSEYHNEAIPSIDIYINGDLGEDIAIAESVSLYMPISINVLDPFHVLVTEVAQIIDLVIEIGVVMDAVNVVDQIIDTLLDVLNIDIADSVSITESIDAHPDSEMVYQYDHIELSESVSLLVSPNINAVQDILITDVAQITDLIIELGVVTDTVGVVDVLDIYLTNLYIDVYESLAVAEHIEVFDIIIEILLIYDTVSVSESALLSLDLLHVSVLDPFHVLITEVANILDIVIEVGVVMEAVSIVEGAGASITELFINISDTATVIENADTVLGELLLDISDVIAITDVAIMTDIIVELGVVVDTAAVTESIQVILPELCIDINESVTVIEYANIFDIIIELGVVYDEVNISEWSQVFDIVVELFASDDISIQDEVTVTCLLGMFVIDNISTVEWINVFDMIIELFVFDAATVTEAVITPFGVSIGDDVGVSGGALTDYISVSDVVEIIIPFLAIEADESIGIVEYVITHDIIVELFAFDTVNIEEYATIFDIIIELGIVFDDILIVEDITAGYIPFTVNVIEAITVAERLVLGTVIYVDVIELITVEDGLTWIFMLEWDLSFPRVYDVIPRQRVFIRDETIYEEG